MLVVELGLYLDKPYIYYENLLKEHGLKCVFECETHDMYYTNNDFSNIDKMTEKEIKDACIRVRRVNCKSQYKNVGKVENKNVGLM